MDKNMINIDDLIRQRLSSGEEEERAGAWLRMRELLDEKQPVRAAAVFNWKRVLSYAAGLVLLAVAGIGGYKAMHAYKDADNAALNRYSRTGNAMLSDAVPGSSSANIAANNTAETVSQADAKKLINDATTNKQSGMVASTGKDAGMLVSKHSSTSYIINTAAPVKTIEENKPTNNPSPEKTTGNNAVVANTSAEKVAGKKGKKATDTKVDDTKLQTSGLNSVNVVASNATNSNKSQQLPVEVTNPRYRKQIKTIDSVEVITTKETGRKGIRKVDTIAQGMIATEKLVDVPVEVAAATTTTRKTPREILPSATLMERNSQDVLNAAMAADSKSDSKQSKNNYNPRRFEEMVQNMKVDLGKVSFHPGLVAGISSSVGAYNMMGIQLGVAGVMEISDRWGMFAELKGIYRFGNGKSFINNYKTVDVNDVQYQNNTYTYTWDSVAHSFNISSSTSIELPIAVRYSANRLSAFAGVNGVYNFAVKVDEYSQSYSRPYVTNTPGVQELVKSWGDNTVIGYDAFKARFMLGYVVGAGYQVTPNIGVDFRATQPITESNAGRKSSAIISKQLYRAPSFQLNFTYKFSNNKYKPREMNY